MPGTRKRTRSSVFAASLRPLKPCAAVGLPSFRSSLPHARNLLMHPYYARLPIARKIRDCVVLTMCGCAERFMLSFDGKDSGPSGRRR